LVTNGVVVLWLEGFEPTLFRAFVINIEISINQLTPYLLEDQDSSYYHEVRVETPFDPMAPFRGAVIGNDIDDAVKKMVHVALMTLCERSLAVTVDAPLALFLIRNQEEPVWQQHHEAVCDITSPQFSFQCSHLAKYTRYLFNLQHNTGRVITEQHAEQTTLTSHAMGGLSVRMPSSIVGYVRLRR
jgi:predicted N-acyltransferase